jgi:hypothetical protein
MNHAAVLLVPLLLLAACASGQQRTVRLLDQRMEARLAPEIAAGRAAVQQTPDGAQITLLDTTLFPNGPRSLDDQYPDVRAEVIEGLLDPALMRVEVADTSALPPYQRETRVRNVEDYFTANGLGSVLLPAAEPTPPGSVPNGLNIRVRVECSPPPGFADDGGGRSRPICD